MSFLRHLGKFLSRFIELRSAPNDVFERRPDPVRPIRPSRAHLTQICTKCGEEFITEFGYRLHVRVCDRKAS